MNENITFKMEHAKFSEVFKNLEYAQKRELTSAEKLQFLGPKMIHDNRIGLKDVILQSTIHDWNYDKTVSLMIKVNSGLGEKDQTVKMAAINNSRNYNNSNNNAAYSKSYSTSSPTSIASCGMRQAHADLMNPVVTITFVIQIMHKLQRKEIFSEKMTTNINLMIVGPLSKFKNRFKRDLWAGIAFEIRFDLQVDSPLVVILLRQFFHVSAPSLGHFDMGQSRLVGFNYSFDVIQHKLPAGGRKELQMGEVHDAEVRRRARYRRQRGELCLGRTSGIQQILKIAQDRLFELGVRLYYPAMERAEVLDAMARFATEVMPGLRPWPAERGGRDNRPPHLARLKVSQ